MLVGMRHILPKARIEFDEQGAWVIRGALVQQAKLAYQNNYWMVLSLEAPSQYGWMGRCFMSLCTAHKTVFRDQFCDEEYRYVRSRLSVAKFMVEPTRKNES